MKTLFASILALVSFASQAQSSSWSLTEVSNTSKEPVGYIYHVYARGTAIHNSSSGTVAAGLRFVCSVRSGNDAPPPVVAVFWNGVMLTNTSQEVQITVDKMPPLKEKWTREGSLVYSAASNESTLINSLKRGRVVRFFWEGNDSSKYAVVFDLKDFNLTEFNNSCKTRL